MNAESVRWRGCVAASVHALRARIAHVCCAMLVGSWALCAPGEAHAEPLQLQLPQVHALRTAAPVFDYAVELRPAYLRATLEEFALLGLGFAQYVANHDLNSLDWDFSYDWSGLRRKLSAEGYSFDTNGFDTNFIRHPAAGTMYYWAARSNRLTIFEAAAISTGASLLWEYLGELRERASINDMLVTPLTGVVLGEMTLQLGAFFDRSCDTLPNRILGSVLGPMKTLHDWIDGARLRRESQCDQLGLSQRGAHAFQFSMGVGPLATVSGPAVPLQLQTQLALHTRMVAIDTYSREGEGMTTFADGNVSEFWLSGAFGAGTWVDFTLRATLLPIGLHYRALQAGRGGLHGYELVFGLLFGTEYRVHRFGWAQAETRQRDRFFELDAPGVSFGYRRAIGAWSLDLELETAFAMLGVDALARDQYLRHASGDRLPTVAFAERYDYAMGLRLTPRARLRWRAFELGAEVSSVRGSAITARERYGERMQYASISELRTVGSVWLSVGPNGWPLRFNVGTSFISRVGVIDATRVARTELRATAGLGAEL